MNNEMDTEMIAQTDVQTDAEIEAKGREPFRIKQAEFTTSVGADTQTYPPDLLAEIAIVGKSNVGKSSLINSLCGSRKLAKVSQSPGKTRLINFFRINHEFYIVDLPGYGFARASKLEQAAWGELMEQYLSSGRVTHLFLLLDIRHEPTNQDKQMYSWMLYHGIPFTLVATKADKLPRSKRRQSADRAAKLVGAPPAALCYSSVEKDGRDALIYRIGQILDDIRMRDE